MPWLETDVRDQRIEFVKAVRAPGATMAAVCRVFRISRKTGYKWLGRDAAAHSVAALADRSRRPLRSPQRTAARVIDRVIALRAEYGWGGEKLGPLLDAEGITLAPRTIDRIIQREGLTVWMRRRPRRSAGSKARRPMSCGRWMRRGTIRCAPAASVTRSASSMITVAMRSVWSRCRAWIPSACARR